MNFYFIEGTMRKKILWKIKIKIFWYEKLNYNLQDSFDF